MSNHTIHHGCCLDVLSLMESNSVDSIVTDPPYGLAFMGKKWDYDVPTVEVWAECLRVLKPGGHLLAFAGTRTQHRMAVRIEDAGFEIRDMIAWVYGSGFPKSLDIGKALDKAAGAKREVVGKYQPPNGQEWNLKQADGESDGHAPGTFTASGTRTLDITAPATEDAKQWDGWGTALKPALEPITLARKPLCGTVAANVLEWGTGGINVDGCRVEGENTRTNASAPRAERTGFIKGFVGGTETAEHNYGRWPANLIHDGSEEVTGLFPQSKSTAQARHNKASENLCMSGANLGHVSYGHNDSGSAARFFYCAKASRSERDAGCEDLEHATPGEITGGRQEGSAGLDNPRAGAGRTSGGKNVHPTVKPLALMRYLVRLVTPPGGVTLDPFLGSGTTAVAALQEGFSVIGIERDEHSYKTAIARVAAEATQDPMFQ